MATCTLTKHLGFPAQPCHAARDLEVDEQLRNRRLTGVRSHFSVGKFQNKVSVPQMGNLVRERFEHHIGNRLSLDLNQPSIGLKVSESVRHRPAGFIRDTFNDLHGVDMRSRFESRGGALARILSPTQHARLPNPGDFVPSWKRKSRPRVIAGGLIGNANIECRPRK